MKRLIQHLGLSCKNVLCCVCLATLTYYWFMFVIIILIILVRVCLYKPLLIQVLVALKTVIPHSADVSHCCAAVDGLNAGVIIVSKLVLFMF